MYRLGLMDSTPPTPGPGTSQGDSPSSSSPTPGRASARKSVPFPAATPSPSKPETSSISAIGFHGSSWSEDESTDEGRAKRELSVIEERDTNSIADDERSRRASSVASPRKVKSPPPKPDDSPDWSGVKGSAVTDENSVPDTEDERPTVNEGSDPGTPRIRGVSLETDDGRGYAQEA